MKDKISVMFVCLGNICRSPIGEGIFQHLVNEAGLGERFHIESSGTSGYHNGEQPDHRMRATAANHGIELVTLSQELQLEDLKKYVYVVAMDHSNRDNIVALEPAGFERKAELVMMRDYDPTPEDGQVPDPYFGGDQGFEDVYHMVYRSCEAFLQEVRERHHL